MAISAPLSQAVDSLPRTWNWTPRRTGRLARVAPLATLRVVAGLTAALLAGSLHAEIVRFKMTGVVTVEHELVLPPDVVTGAPFVAYLSYDTSVPDLLPNDPRRGRYLVDSALGQVALSLQVGSLLLRQRDDANAHITVYDDAEFIPGLSSPDDFVRVGLPSIGGPDRSFNPTLQVNLADHRLLATKNDALPNKLDYSLFSDGFVLAGGGAPRESFYFIRGQVLDIQTVPEPASPWILLCAMLGRVAAK